MASYEAQAAQMNEELPQETSLYLALTQYLRDENLQLRKMCFRFESRTPSSLVLSIFFKLSYLGDFITG